MELGATCFVNCVNLVGFDVTNGNVQKIGNRAFGDCRSLSGKIYLPKVTSVTGSESSPPFDGCTGGVTEIHFPRAAEAPVKEKKFYASDPSLGTTTAKCCFDIP